MSNAHVEANRGHGTKPGQFGHARNPADDRTADDRAGALGDEPSANPVETVQMSRDELLIVLEDGHEISTVISTAHNVVDKPIVEQRPDGTIVARYKVYDNYGDAQNPWEFEGTDIDYEMFDGDTSAEDSFADRLNGCHDCDEPADCDAHDETHPDYDHDHETTEDFDDLRDGKLFIVSVTPGNHDRSFSVAEPDADGSYDPNRINGYLRVPDGIAEHFDDFDGRKKWADGMVETYGAWANNDMYGVIQYEFDADGNCDEPDEQWGLYGNGDADAHMKDGI